jgi:hypothetical protein
VKRWLWGIVALLAAGCASAPHTAEAPVVSATALVVEISTPVLFTPVEAVSPTPLPLVALPEVELKNYGPAPELKNEVWLNVEQPLRLADLRGKVVLIDMWTFG